MTVGPGIERGPYSRANLGKPSLSVITRVAPHHSLREGFSSRTSLAPFPLLSPKRRDGNKNLRTPYFLRMTR